MRIYDTIIYPSHKWLVSDTSHPESGGDLRSKATMVCASTSYCGQQGLWGYDVMSEAMFTRGTNRSCGSHSACVTSHPKRPCQLQWRQPQAIQTPVASKAYHSLTPTSLSNLTSYFPPHIPNFPATSDSLLKLYTDLCQCIGLPQRTPAHP